MECPAGQEYLSCGPAEQNTCSDLGLEQEEQEEQEEQQQYQQQEQEDDGLCVEGCYCPVGKVMWKGSCRTRVSLPLPSLLTILAQDTCPCLHQDREYTAGQEVAQDCNTWSALHQCQPVHQLSACTISYLAVKFDFQVLVQAIKSLQINNKINLLFLSSRCVSGRWQCSEEVCSAR